MRFVPIVSWRSVRLFAADGGAASGLWPQIAADALQKPVTRIDRHPGSSLGAAFVAGMGAGNLKDWSYVTRYVVTGRLFRPDPHASKVLDGKYNMWRESYSRLRTMFPRLGALQDAKPD